MLKRQLKVAFDMMLVFVLLLRNEIGIKAIYNGDLD